MKQEILNKIAELVSLVDQIVEDDSASIIAGLQAQVLDLQNQLVLKEAELVDAKSKLALIDSLAKQIDSAIPDPA